MAQFYRNMALLVKRSLWLVANLNLSVKDGHVQDKCCCVRNSHRMNAYGGALYEDCKLRVAFSVVTSLEGLIEYR